MPNKDAPKKKRQGGKKAKVHAIVSSALVPQSVLNRMQETHHVAPSQAAPALVHIVSGTVVGGPLHASVSVQNTMVSFHSSGISYWKVELPLMVQYFTGFTESLAQHLCQGCGPKTNATSIKSDI